MIDKEVIKRNFSACAPYYDSYSEIQTLSAYKLIQKLDSRSFRRILEIGSGTGNYTRLLHEKFPQAYIKAVDISPAMIELIEKKLVGAEIEFVVLDAETDFLGEGFDLITSNLCLQWFSNLKQALARYQNLLQSEGVFLFSIFGPHTFWELNSSLQEFFGQDVSIPAVSFISRKELEDVLKRYFGEFSLEEEVIKEEEPSLLGLLKKIKYSGGGRGLGFKKIWTPQTIFKLEEIYREKFKKIVVSYQIYFCQARKNEG